MQNVLITGATRGIGYELAKVFARNGYQLILVARTLEGLQKVQEELSGSVISIIPLDITLPDAPEQILSELGDVPVDILVNNAGLAFHGRFFRNIRKKQLEMIDLNVRALVNLTAVFGEQMVFRKRGHIINISSLAGHIPGPGISVYAATKHFVSSFGQSLAYEWRESGVYVTTFCPGPTNVDIPNEKESPNWIKRNLIATPQKVAQRCYTAAIVRKKTFVIDGIFQFWGYRIFSILPQFLQYRIVDRIWRDVN